MNDYINNEIKNTPKGCGNKKKTIQLLILFICLLEIIIMKTKIYLVTNINDNPNKAIC